LLANLSQILTCPKQIKKLLSIHHQSACRTAPGIKTGPGETIRQLCLRTVADVGKRTGQIIISYLLANNTKSIDFMQMQPLRAQRFRKGGKSINSITPGAIPTA